MGRNSILEQLRQQSIQRMRQERVDRLHRERKDRPILLEADKKALTATVPAEAAAAASAAAAAGGGSGRPIPDVPPVDTRVAFKIGSLSVNGDLTMDWNFNKENPGEGDTIGWNITRAGVKVEGSSEISNPVFDGKFQWDWSGIGGEEGAPITLSFPINQNNTLKEAGYYGNKSAIDIDLLMSDGFQFSFNEWNFGTIFNSIESITMKNGNIPGHVTLKGMEHLSALTQFSMETFGEGTADQSISFSINGKNTTTSNTFRALSLNNIWLKDITLSNIMAYAPEGPGAVSCSIQIDKSEMIGQLSFVGWYNGGATGEGEPGLVEIGANNVWHPTSSAPDLRGLRNTFINFDWSAGGSSTPLTTLNVYDINGAQQISVRMHAELSTVNMTNSALPYLSLQSLQLSDNTSLSSITGFANVTAGELTEIDLKGCGTLGMPVDPGEMDTLGGIYNDIATSVVAGRIPTLGEIIVVEIDPEIAEVGYQWGHANLTNPLTSNWAITGDGWSVMAWVGGFTDPKPSFEEACTAAIGTTNYHSVEGDPFIEEMVTFVDAGGIQPLDDGVFVRVAGEGPVYKYYANGDADGSTPPNEWKFWEEVGDCA